MRVVYFIVISLFFFLVVEDKNLIGKMKCFEYKKLTYLLKYQFLAICSESQ